MVRTALALLIVAVVVTVALAVTGHPLDPARHSGAITTIDSAAHSLTLREVGPWMPGRHAVSVRTFVVDRETKFVLVSRSPAAGGGLVEQPLGVSGVRRGDYATVTADRRQGTPRAIAVEVVRP